MYFNDVEPIPFKGADSKDPLSFRYYEKDRMVLGKTMEEQLRVAVSFWHTLCFEGVDMFGAPTMQRPWLQKSDPMERAKDRVMAGFEFLEKLGAPYFCFHDRDMSPAGATLKESNDNLSRVAEWIQEEMDRTKKKLLWGTAQLFVEPKYMSGAATNPDPAVFAYAAGQVKHALDTTHQLGGENYVLWGGREGYETLLNTDMKKELDQFGRFLTLVADYKHKIGFKGLLLIEPKPCEPTIHQYDFDAATVYAFLQKYGLEDEYKVNIEVNHAILAGHTFAHEVTYACANGIFGSLDANEGDLLRGWDTDQFPLRELEYTKAFLPLFKSGGFTSGGCNFDSKLRRQSTDLKDLFYAHVLGMDVIAKALLNVEKIITDKALSTDSRYADWEGPLGKEVSQASNLEQIAEIGARAVPELRSGGQERLEAELFRYLK